MSEVWSKLLRPGETAGLKLRQWPWHFHSVYTTHPLQNMNLPSSSKQLTHNSSHQRATPSGQQVLNSYSQSVLVFLPAPSQCYFSSKNMPCQTFQYIRHSSQIELPQDSAVARSATSQRVPLITNNFPDHAQKLSNARASRAGNPRRSSNMLCPVPSQNICKASVIPPQLQEPSFHGFWKCLGMALAEKDVMCWRDIFLEEKGNLYGLRDWTG